MEGPEGGGGDPRSTLPASGGALPRQTHSQQAAASAEGCQAAASPEPHNRSGGNNEDCARPESADRNGAEEAGKDDSIPFWQTLVSKMAWKLGGPGAVLNLLCAHVIQTKKSTLPQTFWDDRRQIRNRNRSQRNKANRRTRNELVRQQEEKEISALDPEEAAAKKEEAYRQRVKAHLEQQERVQEGLKSGLRIVVECSFINDYSNREVRSMAKQLEYSVVANKRAKKPTALTFCSWTGDIASFSERMGGSKWPVNRHEEPVQEMFPLDQLVMLSPDGTEELEELDSAKVYCIGGIVDRTTKKNVTKNWAAEMGVPAARLPIDKYCPLTAAGSGHSKRHVLNINDVVTALVEYNSCGDWSQALDTAIPERKKRVDDQAKHARRKRKVAEAGGEEDQQRPLGCDTLLKQEADVMATHDEADGT